MVYDAAAMGLEVIQCLCLHGPKFARKKRYFNLQGRNIKLLLNAKAHLPNDAAPHPEKMEFLKCSLLL